MEIQDQQSKMLILQRFHLEAFSQERAGKRSPTAVWSPRVTWPKLVLKSQSRLFETIIYSIFDKKSYVASQNV